MVALVPMRCMMSPLMRCEKKSIGMWRIFHRKLALEVADILPWTRNR